MNRGESAIHLLFREADMSPPTDEQVYTVRDFLSGNISDPIGLLQKGIREVENMKRWRGSDTLVSMTDTVGNHQKRISDMVCSMRDFLIGVWPGFDVKKAIFMAEHHDMSEGISPLGDIPSPLKQKMSDTSRTLLKNIESACISIIAHIDHAEYDYETKKSILAEMEDKKSPESQLVKYFDLIDAYMVSIREYGSGNQAFYPRIEFYQKMFLRIRDDGYLPSVKQIYGRDLDHQMSPLFDIDTLATVAIDRAVLPDLPMYTYWKENAQLI